jgi:hypothetical protein
MSGGSPEPGDDTDDTQSRDGSFDNLFRVSESPDGVESSQMKPSVWQVCQREHRGVPYVMAAGTTETMELYRRPLNPTGTPTLFGYADGRDWIVTDEFGRTWETYMFYEVESQEAQGADVYMEIPWDYWDYICGAS